MSIVTGGVLEAWGPQQRALTVVMEEVRTFAPPQADDDYKVDIAFRSWHNFREPEFVGVQPGAVGRGQRRFIVWHSVPGGLDEPRAVRDWLAGVLPETARLLREFLPTRSKAYPADALADEVEALRLQLLRSSTTG